MHVVLLKLGHSMPLIPQLSVLELTENVMELYFNHVSEAKLWPFTASGTLSGTLRLWQCHRCSRTSTSLNIAVAGIEHYFPQKHGQNLCSS